MDTCLPATSVSMEVRPSRCRQVIRRAMSALLPRRLFLTHGPSECREICLTFDDGPHPVYTPRLLDVLRRHEVLASFFLIGTQVQRYPDIVRRIAAEGHAIGHHTVNHSDPSTTSASVLIREIQQM